MHINKTVLELDDTSQDVIGIYLIILALISVIGNVLLVSSFVKMGEWRSGVNFFIINMALSDILCSGFMYILAALSSLNRRWMFGDGGCYLYAAVSYISSIVSVTSFMNISCFRYVVLCTKYAHRIRGSTKYLVVANSLSWLAGLLFASLPLVGWGRYDYEPYGTACSLHWDTNEPADIAYTLFAAVCVLCLPLTITFYSYVRVTKVIKKKADIQMKLRPGLSKRGDDKEMQAMKIVLVSLTMFLLAWGPYATVHILITMGVKWPVQVIAVVTLLAKSQSAFNPIILATGKVEIRMAIKQLCCPTTEENSITARQQCPSRNPMVLHGPLSTVIPCTMFHDQIQFTKRMSSEELLYSEHGCSLKTSVRSSKAANVRLYSETNVSTISISHYTFIPAPSVSSFLSLRQTLETRQKSNSEPTLSDWPHTTDVSIDIAEN